MTRLVVVSGGGTGIGRAIAERFAAHGERVVILGRRDTVLETTADEINASCGEPRVTPQVADLTDPQQVAAAAAAIAARGRSTCSSTTPAATSADVPADES